MDLAVHGTAHHPAAEDTVVNGVGENRIFAGSTKIDASGSADNH